MPISKTDFIRGLQCQKMLWLDAHAPQLRIVPPHVRAKPDPGNAFGDEAMGIFGDFTETTSFKADGKPDFQAMIAKTQALLSSGKNVVCEAAFSWYGNFCAADILKKEGDGYALYEVKNAFSTRKEFLLDLGFQRLILRKCGVKLSASYLVLNGGENPVQKEERGGQVCDEIIEKDGIPFRIIDVTRAAKAFERTAEKHIFAFGKLKRKDAEMPAIDVGEHCESPYRCW